jgi:hypothetical protein
MDFVLGMYKLETIISDYNIAYEKEGRKITFKVF